MFNVHWDEAVIYVIFQLATLVARALADTAQ